MKNLSELRQLMRYHLDEFTSVDSDNWPKEVKNSLINDSYRELAQRLYTDIPRFYLTTGTITTTADTRNVALPTDCVGAMIRDLKDSNGDSMPLKGRIEDFNDQASSGTPEYFDILGNYIYFYPAPNAALTYTVYYSKEISDMDDEYDEPDFPRGYEDLIVLNAMIRSRLIKSNHDEYRLIKSEFERRYQRMVSTLRHVYSKDVPKVQRGTGNWGVNDKELE